MSKEILSRNICVLIATFSAWAKGKRLPTSGSVQPLIAFFTPKIKKLVLIDQIAPGSDTIMPRIEVYERGRKAKELSSSKWLYILYPFLKLVNSPKTHIIFKLRDFCSVLDYSITKDGTRFDLFIGLECINAIAGIVLKKLGFVKRVIYYVSDYSPNRYKNRWFNNLYLWLDRYAAIHSDFIWDVSPAIQPARIRAGLNPNSSTPVIHVPNGLDPSQIGYNQLDKINPYSLVFMGILRENTGPDIAIKALPEVLKEFSRAKLHIIGGGYKEDQKRLISLVVKFNLKDKVKFYGTVLDNCEMSTILRSCQVGLAPYLAIPGSPRYYGDAGKIRAYAASGLPVITTDVPPLGKELEKKGGAIVVRDNPRQLAMAIMKIFSDRKLYLTLRKNAIAFAKGNTWENSFTHAFEKMGRV